MMPDDELVERCWDALAELRGRYTCGALIGTFVVNRYDLAAIIPIVQAATLDLVESHLSACAYDPAPYTALKYRLAAIRKEPTDGR